MVVPSCFRKALWAAKMSHSSGILVSGSSGKWSPCPKMCLSSVLSTVNTAFFLIIRIFGVSMTSNCLHVKIKREDFGIKIISYSSLFNPDVHIVWCILTSSFIYGHWLMLSGRGHQCAAFRDVPMGMNVCCIKKPAERDVALDSLTQDPV